ncbi:MAG: hypothetical protein HYU29_08615 [Chloroflexi bacterium]|nr:hypothetical protein [Chloroflexota bacterium]
MPAAAAVALLVALALLWTSIGPFYTKIIAWVARPVSSPNVALTPEGVDLWLKYRGASGTPGLGMGVQGLMMQSGPLLVTSLLLATGAFPWRRRLVYVLLSWIVFAVLHSAAVALWSWAVAWTAEGTPFPSTLFTLVIPLIFAGLPALVAAAWCLRYWFAEALSSAEAQPAVPLGANPRKKVK